MTTNPMNLELLQAYADHYGGCDSCDADVAVTEVSPGVYVANVMHDDWCPVLAKHEAR